MTEQLTPAEQELREKIAQYLYGENEPTLIYDGVTFEMCKEIYPDTAEAYQEQADQILTLLPKY